MAEQLRQPAARSIGREFLASLVVFLVALPLCLGIALAAGVPPALGLITGIIGGIVVGSLSGSPLQVSGPAAGLVAIVWGVIHQYGLAGLGIIVMVAGLIQIVIGVFRMGCWFRAVSPSVILGMLAGIGVLIFASQFHVMVDDTPSSSGLENLLSIPQAIVKGLTPMADTSHHLAAALGILTLLSIVGWNLMPSRVRRVPAALIAVVVAVTTAQFLNMPVNYVEIPDQFLSVITLPNMQSLTTLLSDGNVWLAILTFAFVASAETMLSASAVDQMHNGVRTDYNKEIIAQGVGNSLCGFLGSLPMTGVIVRSTANVQAGATTRLSTILHGVWLLGLVALFPGLLEMIPTASLAAILVYTGYKLINPAGIKKLWQEGGKSEVAIYAVTLTMVVATNLLEGVLIGIGLCLLKLLYTFAKLEVQTTSIIGSGRIDMLLRGSATFLSLPMLAEKLEALPKGQEVHVHIEELGYIDHACLELLQNWNRQYGQTGGSFLLEWEDLSAKKNTRKISEKTLAL